MQSVELWLARWSQWKSWWFMLTIEKPNIIHWTITRSYNEPLLFCRKNYTIFIAPRLWLVTRMFYFVFLETARSFEQFPTGVPAKAHRCLPCPCTYCFRTHSAAMSWAVCLYVDRHAARPAGQPAGRRRIDLALSVACRISLGHTPATVLSVAAVCLFGG